MTAAQVNMAQPILEVESLRVHYLTRFGTRVQAVDDVVAVEIVADLFRRLAAAHPEAIERVGTAAMQRRTHLEHARNATAAAVTAETTTLIMRMKKFLRLG